MSDDKLIRWFRRTLICLAASTLALCAAIFRIVG